MWGSRTSPRGSARFRWGTERDGGDRTNLYGGGISLGHPPGATGARMTLVAMQHLEETGGRRAVVSMCMGAGQGMAVLYERV